MIPGLDAPTVPEGSSQACDVLGDMPCVMDTAETLQVVAESDYRRISQDTDLRVTQTLTKEGARAFL